jgi:hypothetical protein
MTEEQKKGYEEALRRIEEVKKRKGNTFNLIWLKPLLAARKHR